VAVSHGRTLGRSEGQGVILSGAKDRLTAGPLRVAQFFTAVALLLCVAPSRIAAQLHGQHWTVTPETDRATVGDTVTLAFRVRLDERDLLFDTVPTPARTLPDWIRVFGVDKLQRQPDRIYVGKARIAFYRPGRQAVPLFSLPFMRSVKGLSRGTLTSDSATVEVVPVLSAGSSATLRDIKEPATGGTPEPLALALGVLALIVAGWLTWRARRRAPAIVAGPVQPTAVPPATRDPYDVATDRLMAIERKRWSASDVARHYAEVTDVLRDYLEAHGVPARERTTSELRWVLAPGLLAGRGRRQFETVFGAADLVKFAHWRPGLEDAEGFLVAARELLASWRESGAGLGVSSGTAVHGMVESA
jgi:LPXTG-motif cell wall-anchored protein